jgi:hypothetical protein
MATETTVATERSVDARTLAEMVLGAAERHDGTALKFKRDDEWAEMSYEELGDRARAYGRGLIALGIEPGAGWRSSARRRPSGRWPTWRRCAQGPWWSPSRKAKNTGSSPSSSPTAR